MANVEEMGKQAYQKQMWGDYENAILIYNSAIKKFSTDCRLLNNRCCCYIEIKDYKRALEDADKMIKLYPNNKKSYYRKGEVLFLLKHYIEAEEAFKKVLSLDPSCEDARVRLIETQTQELCKSGNFNKRQAQQALGLTNSIEDAKLLLQSGALTTNSKEIDNMVYYSDDEDEVINNHQEDPLLDSTNPLGITSLWVGCLTTAITEEILTDLFSKYGPIKSIHYKSENHYAFINYNDAKTSANAMKNLQGHMIKGHKLLIKFPENATSSYNNLKTRAKQN